MAILSRLLLVSIILGLLSGCSYLYRSDKSYSNSSLVEFLYPNSRGGVNIQPSVPNLSMPLKVGIAFVPEGCSSYHRFALKEALKNRLLKDVSDTFLSNHSIFDKFEVIPGNYLNRKGGFENLDQIKRDFDVDIIVLLSYDQVQYTNKNIVSLVYYYTLVGEYIFEGDKNDTSTLIDAAVYDIATRKMLFRASGVSQIKGKSTRAALTEELRNDSYAGFEKAISNLNVRLSHELYVFRQKIKAKEVAVKVSYRSRGGGGGGAMWLLPLGMLIILLGRVLQQRCWFRG